MRAARTTLASCAQTCQALHELAIKYLWQEQDLIGICKAVLPTLAVGRVKWPGQIEVQGVEEADSDDDASDDGNIYSARVYYYHPGPISAKDWSRFAHYAKFVRILKHPEHHAVDSSVFIFLQQHACGKPLFPELRELVWEHATPELLSVISPSIRILSLPGSPEEEEDASLQRKFACDMRRHAFKQLIPDVVQGLPDLEEVVLRSFGHKSFWFPFTSTPNSGFVNQNIRILHMSESSRTLMKAALAAVSTIQNLSELAIDVLRTDIDTEPARLPTSSISPFIKLVQLSVKGPTTAVAALVNVIDAPCMRDLDLGCFDVHTVSRDILTAALSSLFDRLHRRNATTLRKLKLFFKDGLSVFPSGTSADAPFPPLGRPLLELRHLEDIAIQQFTPRGLTMISTPALVAAWPAVRTLSLTGGRASPNFLHIIARDCPQLESLSITGLSMDFVELLSSARVDIPGTGVQQPPRLRQLCTMSSVMRLGPTEVSRVAHFIISLFPHLDLDRCSVGYLPLSSSFGDADISLDIFDGTSKP
ncbi:uncharacterized protein C8Q71DRAFT_859827 [Rhodofomes roseus]|uniref:Uncharacterized protein n=1 Tax=Rhodofomes roseus TaxID=34475 RepID=A0ABQ8KA90_9APHY|nr:uncharacterized protein C8Q71DRAFT_859827 [Rhodofomes roseus]KAH9834172.1 hypothetical protein C8Q71DRAFT_859827 [Rhodofomes roseus]